MMDGANRRGRSSVVIGIVTVIPLSPIDMPRREREREDVDDDAPWMDMDGVGSWFCSRTWHHLSAS